MTISGIVASGRSRLLQLFPLFVTLLAAFAIVVASQAWSGDQTTPAASDDCSTGCGVIAGGGN